LFLVLNSNDNGTAELSDVRLVLPSCAIVVAQTVQLKHEFCCKSERVSLFTPSGPLYPGTGAQWANFFVMKISLFWKLWKR